MQNNNPIVWFEIIKAAAEIFLPLVAIIISLIAIKQTKKQTELSNKQHLFDRRLNNYHIIESLLLQYKNSRNEITSLDKQTFTWDIYCGYFLETTFLKDVEHVVDNPLNFDNRIAFNEKCVWLHRVVLETELIFTGESATQFKEFCLCYCDLLNALFYNTSLAAYEIEKKLAEQTGKELSEMYFTDPEQDVSKIVDRIDNLYLDIVNTSAERNILEQIKL